MTLKQQLDNLKRQNRKLKALLGKEIKGNTFAGYWAGKSKSDIKRDNEQKWKDFKKENKI